MKVLITGATGFVGANLTARLLELGNDVHIIIRPTSNLWRLQAVSNHISPHQADITDNGGIKNLITKIKPEIIYHLGVYGAYHYQSDPQIIFKTSVLGTLNLLEAAKKAEVKMIINTGSSSEYGAKDHPMNENEIIEPNSYYAVGKAGQTLLCQHFSKAEHLPIITLRLFSIYGPYEEPGRLIPTIIEKALAHKDLPLANPKTARDFVYVKDAVEAFLTTAARPDLSGNIFNIGAGQQHTLREIVENIKNLTHSQSKELWGFYKPRDFDTDTWVADTKKTESILKFKPKYSLIEGMTETIEWLKENKQMYQTNPK